MPHQTVSYDSLSDAYRICKGAPYSNFDLTDLLEMTLPDAGRDVMTFEWSGRPRLEGTSPSAGKQYTGLLNPLLVGSNPQAHFEQFLRCYQSGLETGDPLYTSLHNIVIPGITVHSGGQGFFAMVFTPDPQNPRGGRFEMLDSTGRKEIVEQFRASALAVFPDAIVTDQLPYKTFALRGYGTPESERFQTDRADRMACGPAAIRNIRIALNPAWQIPKGDTTSPPPTDAPQQWRANDAELLNERKRQRGHDARLPSEMAGDIRTWPSYQEWQVSLATLAAHDPAYAFSTTNAMQEITQLFLDSAEPGAPAEAHKAAFLEQIIAQDTDGEPQHDNAFQAMEQMSRVYMLQEFPTARDHAAFAAAMIWQGLEADRAERAERGIVPQAIPPAERAPAYLRKLLNPDDLVVKILPDRAR